ncbi:hypothetical protein [Mariniphaga sediminis]|uniref:hypothetical protein n=1 Tax=Mariniphaga sediminis TaxID=1628158 RepID=UPI0035627EB7
MKLESITGVTDAKVRVYKPVSEIMVTKNGNIGSEKVEISRVNGARGTNEQVCPRMELKELFEISAQGEGLYIDKNTGSRGMIRVGMVGAASLSDQRYLEIEFSGLTAGSVYTVYGMEDGEIVERVMVYHPIIINQDEELREFGVTDKELAAFPIANLEKIELVKTNGQTVTFTPEELKAKMEKENDLCAIYDTGAGEVAYYGYRNLALVYIMDAKSVKVHKTVGTGYQLIFIDQA